jgi:glucose/arabinose dehydrogenase
LARNDLGGSDIFNDNPAEDVHRFDMTGGQNYGYPFCFREYSLPPNTGLGRGTAWAWPSFLNNGQITDQQCRESYDVPVLAMQAHSAPLGMTFYKYAASRPSPECDGVEPFPASMDGDAFIAFHGSWNRVVPTGYKVVHVPVTDDGTGVVGGIGADPVDLLKHQGDDARWSDGFRPVDVSFDACGRLLVSSDGSQGQGVKIVRIERDVATLTPGEGFSLWGLLLFFLESLLDFIIDVLLGTTAFVTSFFDGS